MWTHAGEEDADMCGVVQASAALVLLTQGVRDAAQAFAMINYCRKVGCTVTPKRLVDRACTQRSSAKRLQRLYTKHTDVEKHSYSHSTCKLLSVQAQA
jgi:hypothetical protein